MVVYPNQRIITIKKVDINSNREILWGTVSRDALGKASETLNGNAFKIWTDLNLNQNGYEFALSSKDIEKRLGIKKGSYKKAILELIEAGYLRKTKGNHYDFCDLPLYE